MSEIEIINVMASSLDGHIGAAPRESDQDRAAYHFSIPEDQDFVRDQIRSADAIITGAESMRASSGAWQQTGSGDKYPLWVVLSRRGLEPELNFWQQSQIPRAIVSDKVVNESQCREHGVENWVYGESFANKVGQFILQNLNERSCKRVLLFGGGAINRMFYEEGLVNELNLTLCPLVIGQLDAPRLVDSGLSHKVKFKLLSSQAIQSHVFLRYKVENLL